MKRCRERPENVRLKEAVVAACQSIGSLLVLPEVWNTDVVVAIRSNSVLLFIAIEIEFSVRNVVRNIERNFSNGATAVVIVTPTTHLTEKISRKVRREIEPSLQERVFILTYKN